MRYMFFVIGIFILTLGIALTIKSNLGTSPFDALLVGLSRNVGLTVGSWEVILAIIMIICNAFVKMEKPEILGLVTAIITGIGIDFWLFLLHYLDTPEFLISKLLYFSFGLILSGFGTSIYLQTNFAPIPVDHSTLILKELIKSNIFIARTIIYVMLLILAFIFNGPIGVGTVLTVCFGGMILNFFMPITEKILIIALKLPEKVN